MGVPTRLPFSITSVSLSRKFYHLLSHKQCEHQMKEILACGMCMTRVSKATLLYSIVPNLLINRLAGTFGALTREVTLDTPSILFSGRGGSFLLAFARASDWLSNIQFPFIRASPLLHVVLWDWEIHSHNRRRLLRVDWAKERGSDKVT